MMEYTVDREREPGGPSQGALKRRGFVAGAAGLLVAGLAKVSERVARAADGDPLIVGSTANTAASPTRLARTNPTSTATALTVTNDRGPGLQGESTSANSGVIGVSGTAHGVLGQSASGPGVQGTSGSGPGLYGRSTGNAGAYGYSETSTGTTGESGGSAPGVFGASSRGVGVYGNSPGNVGVYGYASSGYGMQGNSESSVGVYGNSTSNLGVFGRSGTGVGVYGASGSSMGVIGESGGSSPGVYGTSPGGVGVYGNSAGGVGVYGASATGYAGRFDGALLVNGSFTATGIKSAAVPYPDGTYRRLYCLESPESYFEDFGRAQLVRGRAKVRLDPEFAAVVRTDDYDVFLTVYGDSRGLFVAERNAVGFEVWEQQGGTTTLTFSYRVLARRGDVERNRLEKVPLGMPAVTPPGPPRELPEPRGAPIARPAGPLRGGSR